MYNGYIRIINEAMYNLHNEPKFGIMRNSGTERWTFITEVKLVKGQSKAGTNYNGKRGRSRKVVTY